MTAQSSVRGGRGHDVYCIAEVYELLLRAEMWHTKFYRDLSCQLRIRVIRNLSPHSLLSP
jgi:hypothetical protein